MGWKEMAKAVQAAELAALAAIHADSEDAWAHYALASVYLFTRRFDDCLSEFELALKLNPSFSPARGLLRRRTCLLRPLVRRRKLRGGDRSRPRGAASAS